MTFSARKIPWLSSRFNVLSVAAVTGGAFLAYKNIAYAENRPEEPPKRSVFLWGDNTRGLIANTTLATAAVRTPTRVPFLDNQSLRSLAACPEYAVAALKNGDVVQWTNPDQHEVILKSKDIKELRVSPQSHVALALAKSGNIWTWRQADNGETVAPTQMRFAARLGMFEKIVDIQCGADHVIALTNKGKVFSAALNEQSEHFGQLGIAAFPHFEKLPEPNTFHQIKLLESPVKQIACGVYHSLFLCTNGVLYGSGSNMYGQLMLPYTIKNMKNPVPTKISGLPFASPVLSIAAGSNVSYIQSGDGTWFAAGDGEFGQFGTGSFSQCQNDPVRISALDSMREFDEVSQRVVPFSVTKWAIGETHVFARTNNRYEDWFVWGNSERGQIGNNKLSKVVKPVPVTKVVVDFNQLDADEIIAGDKISGCYHSCK